MNFLTEKTKQIYKKLTSSGDGVDKNHTKQDNTVSHASTTLSSEFQNQYPEEKKSEQQRMLESIEEDYLKLNKKFYSITDNKNTKVFLELEEQCSRLIYRVDDVEPVNEDVKQLRTQLIKTIHGMVDVMRKRIEMSKKKDIDVINFEEFLPILNEAVRQPVVEAPIQFNYYDAYQNFVEVNKNKMYQDSEASPASDDPCQSVYGTSSTTKAVKSGKIIEQNYEGPLQLLHINTETGLFELDEVAVKSVLLQPQVKNRKIAILSIIGAFRRENSFLLNLLLHYLKAQGSPDWSEQCDKLEGFSWRGGMNEDITGILMWSKAFLFKDLAVVLLDTQGTFDSQTSMKENTFIFALSTLLSSVQIYNLNETIQMNYLCNVQYFLEFGRMVQKTSNSKAFGNLVFLIRDCNFKEGRDFGFEVGDQLLKESWLKMGERGVTQQQIELIDTCFMDVKCFLMPHPGKVSSQNPKFQGYFGDIDAESLQHLKHFIESIFEGGILSGKQIGGEFVKAEQFLMYMTTYVDKLQHPDIEPNILYQSICDTSHSNVVSHCKEFYMREMQRAVREVTCDIQAAHQHAVDAALSLYAFTPKFGVLCDNNLYKKKLVQVLEELHERYVCDFEHHAASKFHGACFDAYETYQNNLNAFCMQVQNNCSLQDKSREACKKAVESLKNLKLKISQEKIDNETTTLIKKMENYYKIQEASYKARQEHEKQVHMNLVKQDVLHCYQTMMDTHCGGPDLVPQFDATCNKAHLKALDVFHSDIIKYNLHESSQLFVDINEEMDKICKCYKKQNERKIEKVMEDKFNICMIECHLQFVETYRSEMYDNCVGIKVVENIPEVHKRALEKAKNLYIPYIHQYGENSCIPYINKSYEFIDGMYAQYVALNAEMKYCHNAYERVIGLQNTGEMLQNSGWQYYEEQMRNLNIGVQPVSDLHNKHEYFKTTALSMLDSLIGSNEHEKRVKNLEQGIEKKYNSYVQQNNKVLQDARCEQIKNALEKCVNLYAKNMDALEIDEHPVEDLLEKHGRFSEEALAEMKYFLTDKESHVINNVKQEIHKKWQMYKNKNEKITEIFKNEEIRTVRGAYNEMKVTYLTNINKGKDTCLNTKDVTQLFQFHETEKKSALNQYQEMVKECGKKNIDEYYAKLESDIQTLFEAVEESLSKSLRVLRIKEEEINSKTKKSYAIGIDLGTTNSCAAVYRNGKVEMIYSDKLSDKNKTTTPSVVYFGEEEILFGETAVVKGFVDPKNCISEMKRIIGRRFDDPVVETLIKDWPFDVTNSNETPVINVNCKAQKSFKPEEVSSLLLGEMKRIAEVYLGSQVHDAVVTIPAYFNGLQREATKAACVKAGLNVLRMINEPTAAAIAFGLQCKTTDSRTLLVFDFGGGTCDISIVAVEGEKFTVKASKGDNKLGGEDFDDHLTEYVAEIIEAKYNVKIDVKEKRRLRHNCERVKRNLTQNTKYVLQIEQFTDAKVDVEVHVSREKFEELNTYLFHRMLNPIRQCLTEAKLSVYQIDEVVLVGGSSRIPKIRQILREYFNGKKMNVNINPDEAIAYGAAIQAAICTEEYIGNIRISEITPISLGTDVKGEDMSIIIPKNTKIPCTKSMTYVTLHDYQNALQFDVYQGECNKIKGNTLLGKFTLEGITLAPQGKTAATVTFRVDADGILHVKAVERGKENNQKSITITKKVL